MDPVELQWYDRSPICTLALSRYLGYLPSASLVEELERIERERIYQRHVFFIENLGFYQPSEVRKITFEESLVFENIHEETYIPLGYDLIKIAPDALSERVHRIMEWTSPIMSHHCVILSPSTVRVYSWAAIHYCPDKLHSLSLNLRDQVKQLHE